MSSVSSVVNSELLPFKGDIVTLERILFKANRGLIVKWISNYQLFLLDLDGLLVNTEELHFEAYRTMCARRGYSLDLSFREYCGIAHKSSEGLEQMVYRQFPALLKTEPQWKVLYAEKKAAYIELIKAGAVHMMPGAERFLIALNQAGVKRCVVTNSAADLVEIIQEKNPVLSTIPKWFTRESYSHPKPHPECYQRAVAALAVAGDRIIGFEDSARGLEALKGTPAQRVLICEKDHPVFPPDRDAFVHFESLDDLPEGSALSSARA